MEDESQTEHITDWFVLCFHVFDVDNFRSDVSGSTTSNEKILISIREFSKTEVSNYQVATSLLPEDKILRFKISVHSFFAVHLLETVQNGKDDLFDFMGFEFFFGFDFIVKKSSLKQLNNHVEGILWFEDFMEAHAVSVIENSHDFYLFDQTFFSFIFAICCLFWESFDGIVSSIFNFLSQIYWSKVSFTNFLLWYELFMETSLVELLFKNLSPELQLASWPQLIGLFAVFLLQEDWGWVGDVSEFEVKIKWDICFSW